MCETNCTDMMMESKRLRIRHSVSSSDRAVSSVHHENSSNQGFAALIVMIAVLTIIILFCCFAAPGIRDLCKRYVFRCCVIDDPDTNNATTATESATPTIILLPYGRMLVVDRSMFNHLQADHTGIDFMELSANIIRSQRYQTGSTPSILDSETTSKGLSPTSLGISPPAYEDLFYDKNLDLPPSYSELSLMFRAQNRYIRNNIDNNAQPIEIEMSDIHRSQNLDMNDSDFQNEIQIAAGGDNSQRHEHINYLNLDNTDGMKELKLQCKEGNDVSSENLDQSEMCDANNANDVRINIEDEQAISYTEQNSDDETQKCYLRESSL